MSGRFFAGLRRSSEWQVRGAGRLGRGAGHPIRDANRL